MTCVKCGGPTREFWVHMCRHCWNARPPIKTVFDNSCRVLELTRDHLDPCVELFDTADSSRDELLYSFDPLEQRRLVLFLLFSLDLSRGGIGPEMREFVESLEPGTCGETP